MKAIDNLKRWAKVIGNFFSDTFIGRSIVFISLPLALLVVAFWETEQEPPIFDAQVHYNIE
ncbi:MAG: hypothetical protein OEN49_04495, partial [Gammaproteobacteria bacterium]|nr:hypothetical protein [Gammaproteobacteria bacterium]